ncbi:MAG: recombinase family protein [Sphaerochaetaceae bacterium]|nr:recombinase family protein [Sphaerochaetaceae bacterium]
MVGIYVRTSTLKQSKKYSPKVQRDNGIEFAKSKGEDFVIYEESASGGSLDRQKLRDLFGDIEKGFINKVWVIEQSRISRDMEDSTYISKLFLQHRCELYIDSEFVDLSSSRSRFFYNISSAVSDYERSEIKARMKRGRDASFNKGKKVLSRCYGYTFDWEGGKRKWKIDDYQADIIRLIYKMFVDENSSLKKIIQNLNDREIKSFSGGYWSDRVLKGVLSRKEYAGLTTDADGNLIKSTIYDPIITQEQWEESCQKLELFKKKYDARKEKFRYNTGALSNLVKCKYCGQPFKYRNQNRKYDGVNGKSIYNREIYYHSGDITCSAQTPKIIYRHQLESAFEIAYLNSFVQEESRREWLENKKKEVERFNATHKVDISRIDKKIRENEKKINNLVDALSLGVAVENIKTKLTILETENSELIEKKEKINSDYQSVLLDFEDAEKYFFSDVVKHITDLEPVEKRKLYNNITDFCTICGTKMHVKFITGQEYFPEIDVYHKLASDILREMKDKRDISKQDLDSHIMIIATQGEAMKKEAKSYKEKLGNEERTKGSHCFGFDYRKNRPFCTINEDEAETVKRIFQLRNEGHPYVHIAHLMIKEGRKKKLGTTDWKSRDIKIVLSRIQVSGRWYDNAGNVIKSFRFPEIITPELFDAVSKIKT